MSTTLKDANLGLTQADASQIPHYYVFPFKFWFKEQQVAPEDVLTWCRKHCTGAPDESYYKVVCYTHKSSVRVRYRPKEFEVKVVYVDHIFLSNEKDAARIKLKFNVSDQKVKRPEKLKPRKRRKKKKDVRISDSNPATRAKKNAA
jgi:hypothetical protein